MTSYRSWSHVGRALALARVAEASQEWQPWARLAVYEAACESKRITSDSVWRVLHRHGIEDPAEHRAMGPAMVYGVKMGWIRTTTLYENADDPATLRNHGRGQRVYSSRVFGDPLPSWAGHKKP